MARRQNCPCFPLPKSSDNHLQTWGYKSLPRSFALKRTMPAFNQKTRLSTGIAMIRSNTLLRLFIITFVFNLLLGANGCSQFSGDWKTPDFMPKDKSKKTVLPARILTIWTDTVLHKQNEKGQRGFGGRVLFYGENANDPMQVEGTLTIYAFADEIHQQSKVPEKKFVFGPEQLKKHFSRCTLGDSYSVWLPWDVVGGPSRQISLVTRFEGINGGTVISEPAKKLLPGTSDLDSDVENSAGVQTLKVQPSLVTPSLLTPMPNHLNAFPAVPKSTLPIGSGAQNPLSKSQPISNTAGEGGQISLASFLEGDAGIPADRPGQNLIKSSPSGKERASVETINLSSLTGRKMSHTISVPTNLALANHFRVNEPNWDNGITNNATASADPAQMDGVMTNDQPFLGYPRQVVTSIPDQQRIGIGLPNASSLTNSRFQNQNRETSSLPEAEDRESSVRQANATIYYGRPGEKSYGKKSFNEGAFAPNPDTNIQPNPSSPALHNQGGREKGTFSPVSRLVKPLDAAPEDFNGATRQVAQLPAWATSPQFPIARREFRSQPWKSPVRTVATVQQSDFDAGR